MAPKATSPSPTSGGPPPGTVSAVLLFDTQREPTVERCVNCGRKFGEEFMQSVHLVFFHSEKSRRKEEEKRNLVGLLEGLLQLTGVFSAARLAKRKEKARRRRREWQQEEHSVDNSVPPPLASLEIVRTKWHVIVIREVEAKLFLALVYRTGLDALSSDAILSSTDAVRRSKETELEDEALKNVLRDFHSTFRLLHGPIRDYLPTAETSPASLDRNVSHGDDTAVRECPDGTCDFVPKGSKEVQLLRLLTDFCTAFLGVLPRPLAFPWSALDGIEGFHFAPVDRTTHLAVHSFVSQLQFTFPCVHYVALLFNAHLVFSGLPQETMTALYRYLVVTRGDLQHTKLLKSPYGRSPVPDAQDNVNWSSFGRVNPLVSRKSDDPKSKSEAIQLTGFLLGPQRDSADALTAGRNLFVPTITMEDGSRLRLVVYVYRGFMLLLLIEPPSTSSDGCGEHNEVASLNGDGREAEISLFLKIRDTAVGEIGTGGLQDLLTPISQQYERVMGEEDANRFVYFNSTNLALRKSNKQTPFVDVSPSKKTSSGSRSGARASISKSGGGEGCGVTIATDREASVASSLALLSERTKSKAPENEDEPAVEEETTLGVTNVAVKSQGFGWCWATRSMYRQFYVLLDDAKGVDFSEAQKGVARFAHLHFSNIFV